MTIVYLPSEQSDAEATKRSVEQENRTCLLFPGDLRDRNICRNAVEEHVKTSVELATGQMGEIVTDVTYSTGLV